MLDIKVHLPAAALLPPTYQNVCDSLEPGAECENAGFLYSCEPGSLNLLQLIRFTSLFWKIQTVVERTVQSIAMSVGLWLDLASGRAEWEMGGPRLGSPGVGPCSLSAVGCVSVSAVSFQF